MDVAYMIFSSVDMDLVYMDFLMVFLETWSLAGTPHWK
jgi:hypothetical protein